MQEKKKRKKNTKFSAQEQYQEKKKIHRNINEGNNTKKGKKLL